MEEYLSTGKIWDLIVSGVHVSGKLVVAHRNQCCLSVSPFYQPKLLNVGLRPGAEVLVEVAENECVVRFESQVVGWYGEPGRGIIIRRPRRTERSERRRAARVPLLLDAVVHGPHGGKVECLVRDLSASGMRGTVKANVPSWVKMGGDVNVVFYSPQSGHISRPATIRRFRRRSLGSEIGLEFLHSDEGDYEQLATYVDHLFDERSRRGVG